MRVLIIAVAVICCTANPTMKMPSSSMQMSMALNSMMQHPMAQSLNSQLTSISDPFSEYGQTVVRLPKPGKDFSLPDFLKKVANNIGTDSLAPIIPIIEAASPIMTPALTQVASANQPKLSHKPATTNMDLSSPEVTSYSQTGSGVHTLTPPQSITPAISQSVLGAQSVMMPSEDLPSGTDSFHAQDQSGQYTFSFKGDPSSQFQARGSDGRYAFGHWGGPTAQFEAKDSAKGTAGLYSYVNPEGDVDMRTYLSSTDEGFRVAASDLPIDNPDVAQLKAVNAYDHAMRTLPSIPITGAEGDVYRAIL